jgi:hypothetical protein
VLLDAAKACGTAPPDLAACAADFVVLSFYKIFGYPTGESGQELHVLARQCTKVFVSFCRDSTKGNRQGAAPTPSPRISRS